MTRKKSNMVIKTYVDILSLKFEKDPFRGCGVSLCIFTCIPIFKVPYTPSIENYDNSFAFFGNLMIKWAKPTENMSHVIAHEMHPG